MSADIVTLLSDEHQEAARQLEAFAVADSAERRKLFLGLADFLVRHEVAEEIVLYPVLSMAPGVEELAAVRIAEQCQVAALISEMEAMDPDGEEFAEAFNTLRSAVLEHARSEEASVFPLLKRHGHAALLVAMGKRYKVIKYAVPPSDTHSAAVLAETIRNVSPDLRPSRKSQRLSSRRRRDGAPLQTVMARQGRMQEGDGRAS